MNSPRTVLSQPETCSSTCVALGSSRKSCVARHHPQFKILWLLLILVSGCHSPIISVPKPGCYYLNPDKDLCAVGRVAVVELGNDSSYPQISVDVTKAVFVALQKSQVFGLTVVHQDDPVWRSLQLGMNSGPPTENSTFGAPSTYTLDQLLAMRKTLRCDAVLVGTVTEYQPYPRMAIGLRAKLVDLRDGQLLWALEQVWDSADKAIEQRITDYVQSQVSSGLAPLRERLVVVSSLQFIKFVAYEVAGTLKPGQ